MKFFLNVAYSRIIFCYILSISFFDPHSINFYDRCFENNDQHDALFSVTPLQQRYYYKNGKAVNHDPQHLIQTQFLEPLLHENSCMYIFSKEVNKKVQNRLGKNPYLFEIDHLEAVDIDEWHDFLWAEFLLKNI